MAPVMLIYSVPSSIDGWLGSWSPGIGDPTVAGWLTVIAYFAAAALCFRAAHRLGARHYGEVMFWRLLAFGLAALGINKQLDLQSAVTELGRWLVRHNGLQDQKRELQRWFIEAVLVIAICLGIALVWSIRRSPGATKVAAVGVCALLTFVVVRAASFHHFDHLIGVRLLGLKLNWVLELGGIFVVIGGAWRRLHVLGKNRRT
jgi:hypothetical protein